MNPPVGLAVIYRWRLHPGKETQFRQGWERATRDAEAETYPPLLLTPVSDHLLLGTV